MKRAQGTVETSILLAAGVINVITAAFIVKENIGTFWQISEGELTRAALDDLAFSGSSLGASGSRAIQQITLPNNVKNITLRNKTIELYFYGGKIMIRNTNYPIYGQINVSQGKNYIPIQSIEKGICFGDPTLC